MYMYYYYSFKFETTSIFECFMGILRKKKKPRGMYCTYVQYIHITNYYSADSQTLGYDMVTYSTLRTSV